MALEDDLLAALDEQTEPHAAWKAGKEDIQKGTAAVRGKKDYTVGVKGPEVIDTIESYATDLYTGMGRAGNGDPKILANNLRTTLGEENYGILRGALERGDVDEANKVVKDGLVDEVGAAKLNPILEKTQLLPSDARLKWSKKAVEKVGGTEYMRAATSPAGIARALGQQKTLASAYKP